MGSMTLALCVVVAAIAIQTTDAANKECPLPSKVYGCSPKCVQDYECTNGKVCCANGCNAKSCAVPAPQGTGTGSSGKYGGSSLGVYCDNAKCSPHEICKMDPITKRNKCGRA